MKTAVVVLPQLGQVAFYSVSECVFPRAGIRSARSTGTRQLANAERKGKDGQIVLDDVHTKAVRAEEGRGAQRTRPALGSAQ